MREYRALVSHGSPAPVILKKKGYLAPVIFGHFIVIAVGARNFGAIY